jgi:hypothetical protein
MPVVNPKAVVHRKRRKSQAEIRENLRDVLWPDCEGKVWDRHSNQGFTTVPRLIGLVMVLIKKLSKRGADASRVYLDLWLRSFDEGFVNVVDDGELAFSSGYGGTRATRSWQERINQLHELGFIDVKPRGNTQIGYVLLWNPLRVCAQLRAKGKVDDEWWNAYIGRAADIGATLPQFKSIPAAKKPR